MTDTANQNKRHGLAWALSGSLCFTAAMSLAKLLDPNVKSTVLVFFRCLFGLIFFLPFLFKAGVSNLKTQRPLLHVLRVLFTCSAIACTYYGYRNLPLAVAISIGFTAPLMTTVLAIVFLKETITFKKWILILTGYLGVLVITQPSEFNVNNAVYVLLLANLFASSSMICAKKLTRTESVVSLMFYVNIISTCLSGIAAYFVWVIPSLHDFIILLFIGLSGVTAQLCYVKSLQLCSPSFLAPFDYGRLIIAVPIGFILFNELPNVWTFLGSGIIIAATLLVMRLELKRNS
ncbi:MAG: DMT family transporter [Pseudomonadota bacterium]